MNRRKTPSLRTRLALGYTAFFGVVLLLLGIGVTLTVRSALRSEMERELDASGELIQEDFDATDTGLGDYFNSPACLQRTRPLNVEGLESPSLYVQAANLAGEVVVTSASLQGQRLPLDATARTTALATRLRTSGNVIWASWLPDTRTTVWPSARTRPRPPTSSG